MVIEDDLLIGEMVGSPVLDKLANAYGLTPVEVDSVDTQPTDINHFSYEDTMSIIAIGVETQPVLVEVIDATGDLIPLPQTETPVIGKGDTVEYLKEGSTIPRQHRVRCNPFPDRTTGKPMVYLGFGSGFPALVERLTLVTKAGPTQPAKAKYRRRRRAAA